MCSVGDPILALPERALALVLRHAHDLLSENLRHRRVSRAWNRQLRAPQCVARFGAFPLKECEVRRRAAACVACRRALTRAVSCAFWRLFFFSSVLAAKTDARAHADARTQLQQHSKRGNIAPLSAAATVTPRMFAILVGWLHEVCDDFRLSQVALGAGLARLARRSDRFAAHGQSGDVVSGHVLAAARDRAHAVSVRRSSLSLDCRVSRDDRSDQADE